MTPITLNGWSFSVNEDSTMCVALVGNLSDGYGAVGPFEDFEDACLWTEGQESWIMTMQCPTKEYDDPKDADKTLSYIRGGCRVCQSCGSTDLASGEIDEQLSKIYRPMTCSTCGNEWTEVFTVTGVTNND